MIWFSSIFPEHLTIASYGEVRMFGLGWIGRRPGFNSLVKQSCRLLKVLVLDSERSKSLKVCQSAMELFTIQGCSSLLHQPIKRVRVILGIRLVSKKLRSSCWASCLRKFVNGPSFSCKNFSQHINPGTSWKPLLLVLAYWLRSVPKFIVESNYPEQSTDH